MKASRYLVVLAVFAGAMAWAPVANAYNYIHSCQPAWGADQLPLSYYINDNGAPGLTMSTVESIVADSFASWQQPCCSGFDSRYEGNVSLTAHVPSDDVVISWTDQWPSSLGNASRTLAVTQAEFGPLDGETCDFNKASILFNSQSFSFSDDGIWDTADLESVTTHEVGHLLGLGHTSYSTATMYAMYGGTAATRTLHADDIDGVCDLYPRAAGCECTDDGGCDDDQRCTDGSCVARVACTDHAECPADQMCSQGACVPDRCDGAGDCPSGLACDGMRCQAGCSICKSCLNSDDCDGASFCATLDDGTSLCMAACGPDTECPGNTRCYGVQLESRRSFGACLNEDVERDGICPDGFECVADDSVPPSSCPGLGNHCNSSAPSCGSMETVCFGGWQSDDICTCSCSSDADCGPGGTCEEAGNRTYCLPEGYTNPPCDTADCEVGEVCIDGACTSWFTTGAVIIDPPDAGHSDAGGPDAGGQGQGDSGQNDTGGRTDSWSADRHREQARGFSDDDGCTVGSSVGGGPSSLLGFVWVLLGLGVCRRLRSQ